MTQPIDPSGLNDMLAQTMAMLGQFQTGPSGAKKAGPADAQENEAAEPVKGHGESADGMIEVQAELPGRVSRITLDERVGQKDTEALAAELTTAVNAALADLRKKTTPVPGKADFSGLSEQLKEIQEKSSAQLASFTDVLAQAQEHMARSNRKK